MAAWPDKSAKSHDSHLVTRCSLWHRDWNSDLHDNLNCKVFRNNAANQGRTSMEKSLHNTSMFWYSFCLNEICRCRNHHETKIYITVLSPMGGATSYKKFWNINELLNPLHHLWLLSFILPEKIMNILWRSHWKHVYYVLLNSNLQLKRERDFMPWIRWDSIRHYLSAVSPKGHVVMSLLWEDGRILKLTNWACVPEGTSGPSPSCPSLFPGWVKRAALLLGALPTIMRGLTTWPDDKASGSVSQNLPVLPPGECFVTALES